jgi:hypothetical protein
MSLAVMVKTLIKAAPRLTMMSLSLFWMYLTLGLRVRKARRAFEKQLVSEGMSTEDARRLSACFDELKNSVTSMLRRGVTVGIGR